MKISRAPSNESLRGVGSDIWGKRPDVIACLIVLCAAPLICLNGCGSKNQTDEVKRHVRKKRGVVYPLDRDMERVTIQVETPTKIPIWMIDKDKSKGYYRIVTQVVVEMPHDPDQLLQLSVDIKSDLEDVNEKAVKVYDPETEITEKLGGYDHSYRGVLNQTETCLLEIVCDFESSHTILFTTVEVWVTAKVIKPEALDD